MAIKFFIQKDLPHEVQTEICETIAALGGRVETKVPRAGYILVQPGTLEADRLRMCWSTPDRPERYFVPYTYVEACKVSGMLLKQIFIHNGQPIRMHIDSSIANVNVRATLSARISHSGGDPSASAQSARVILADPNTEVFQHLVKTYQGEPEKYVESYLWVKKCIEKGALIYTPVVYKNPGGRRPGEERTQFTEQDEENLCTWIAAKIPYKETGGRTGNRLYQQLCEMSSDPEYSWVTRHTWQSWRERYKKNASRLDRRIAQIVDEKKPALGEKGQYGYVRKPEEKPRRSRKKKNQEAGENAAGPSHQDEAADATPVPLPPVAISTSVGPSNDHEGAYPMLLYPSGPQPGFPQLLPPGAGPIDPALAQQHATEQELEDDEPDWRIKEGSAPQPAWAKRKHESEEEEPAKRTRVSNDSYSDSSTLLHVVDRGILHIAQEHRFTVEEVQEYYDKCGDMQRTNNRFRRMREVLQSLPDDDPVPFPSHGPPPPPTAEPGPEAVSS
ncbi:hypothetical protein K474DRAFT_1591692 [Panus rudis PR-1116 ss-1]|nr:hypothetical protein K474DRAFT_1591692 [Panus rudis PR-1116 ss-1]